MKAWIVKDSIGIILCYDYPRLIDGTPDGVIWRSNTYRELKRRDLPKEIRDKINNHDIFEVEFKLKKIHKCTKSL